MRNKENKHLGIEIDKELHYKLHYISKYYGRSANGEILFLIRQAIKEFERQRAKFSSRATKTSKKERADFFCPFFVDRVFVAWYNYINEKMLR